MTLRLLLATSLAIAGALLVGLGFSAAATNETLREIFAAFIPIIAVIAGLVCFVQAAVIVLHDDRVRRFFDAD